MFKVQTLNNISVNGLERLFGPMVDSAVKTGDQSGPIMTAAYESVASFMSDNGLMAQTYRLDRNKP